MLRWGMSYGYSDDLRMAALSYYDKGGVTQSQVSEIFGVALKTLSNWIRLRKAGDFSRRFGQKKKGAVKIDEEALQKYIQEHPDAYNREVAEHFGVHPTTIHYARTRLGRTSKKNSALRRKK